MGIIFPRSTPLRLPPLSLHIACACFRSNIDECDGQEEEEAAAAAEQDEEDE